ncbi:glycosyltransferase [Oxynema aestuarii]|jgi:glycosyltransferase involved in cell wall biosynthesis|uniref:Glycosyltransferase n=1 Tax=Oxynema aestuarii AP17 TaxID=2064643 RepID=A0A6H1U382_9CYAN|nr:glycosyltransferase [Oxynema aestuarii]QIZ72493.1 glycosyltransferase [Oxynema aestuarii AP17]
MSPAKLTVSLVTTVLNDRQGCAAFFTQMEAQTHLPDEIVIVDGGSTDGSWEFLQNYQPNQPYSLRVIQDVGCNVARGRNLAIAHAKHDIIVSTDIGCYWEPQWLEELARPLLEDRQLKAVMGSWQVRWEDLKSDWAKVEYALHDGPKLIANPKSHASSRAIAYRKSLWEKIGGYPEDLTLAGDDMVFALLLHQITDRVGCTPIPRCYWERPVTLKALCKEARRNFRGAAEAGIWLKHGLLVGGRLFLELLLLLTGLVWLLFASPIWIGLLFLSGFFISAGLRVIRLFPAIKRLNSCGYSDGWFQILVLEYLIKFWSIVGYWERFLYGFRHCRECRKRLRSLKIQIG